MYISVMERKGIEKGIDLSKTAVVQRMLRQGIDRILIAELVDLPEEQVRQIARNAETK